MKLGVRGRINLAADRLHHRGHPASATWKPGIDFDVYGTMVELQKSCATPRSILIALLSLVLTPNEHRAANGFTWEPIREVAILFAGIFVCIIPVLAMLQAGKTAPSPGCCTPSPRATAARTSRPISGSPACSRPSSTMRRPIWCSSSSPAATPRELMGPLSATLAAISMGAVYMGALTYIGNAPNFMVYAIANEHGVRMPSFFGYMLWSAWSCCRS